MEMSISMFIKICISFFSIILFIVIAYISYAQVNIYKVIWRERFLDEKHFLEVYNFQDNKIKIYDNYEVIVKPLNSYSDGVYIDGLNGGTGWTEAWGDTSGICSTWYTVDSAVTQGSSLRSMKTVISGGQCGRKFTADSTENQIYTVYMRQAV